MPIPDYFSQPVFVLTFDLEWAPEAAVAFLLNRVAAAGIVPHVFVTHASAVLARAAAEGRAELGIHPNFLPNSTHGTGIDPVIDSVLAVAPEARSWRSHSFVDSTPLSLRMVERGILYDSNLCLFLQPNLFPLEHHSGLLRFPVFWEDDSHWRREPDWEFSRFEARFFDPGLKVINIHPLNFALNVPSQQFYDRIRGIQPGEQEDMCAYAYPGKGTATFVADLVAAVDRRGHRFTTLETLYRHHREPASLAPNHSGLISLPPAAKTGGPGPA